MNLQMQMIAELSRPYVGRNVPSASRATIERFSDTPEGKALVMEWGVHARRKVAVVTARMTRIYSRLNDHETEGADYFLNNITGPEFKAILSYLARAS